MQSKEHWDHVYTTKPAESVSWFQEHAEQSLRLIRCTGVSRSGSIIDVGGGASTLVDDPLTDGYSALTVLDLSASALSAAKQRLGRPDAMQRSAGDALPRRRVACRVRCAVHLLAPEKEQHHTPFGTVQKFVYCYCRKSSS